MKNAQQTQKYHYLNPGENIQIGDEFYSKDKGIHIPYTDRLGTIIKPDDLGSIPRRPVGTPNVQEKEDIIADFCHDMEKYATMLRYGKLEYNQEDVTKFIQHKALQIFNALKK
jgi:hypothetical protein